ncbi:type VI secretion system membrane subunit TssM [Xanthomonas euvesicatoria]|uniref:type VI secretion system membrane subunit TssM n=1 Tax=Xanthomonas euvesicatoria TaxID=456327 RepID=UPI0026E42A61|nr:type VI secretion system membrane subunit TssM [Xanthomonas euvesicatoria]MDO7958850.1 type VI secretion system membrane subunit TssM [Xanthomonas euvesicatoria pv. eucalypti]
MRLVLDFLRTRYVASAAVLALLAMLVWVGGPYLSVGRMQPLASVSGRLLAVAVLLLVWAGWRYLRWRHDNAKQQRMAGELVGPGASAEDASGNDSRARAAQEQVRLRARFAEAMAVLRRRRRNGPGLHVLPWYLLIGAPGSGKSTLLQSSGLEFPLKEHGNHAALEGVGGTRNCDWWFADQAVFLDSAGRYTTQDSDAIADAGAWHGFLDLLRRHRRQPLNGVIVTVSVAELLELDGDAGLSHARAVRHRLDELVDKLRARVPVYLVVTKCDLVSGFAEFFADLDAAGRAQVWGVSFPQAQPADDTDPLTRFPTELERLLERIDQRVLERLHRARDARERAAVLSFPQQLRLLQPTLMEFVQTAFGRHGYAGQPWLRGVYLSSGTQQGHPIDRVISAVARHFGVAAAGLPPAISAPRSYFLPRLLNDVVFAEAGLAGSQPGSAQRRRLLQLACWAVLTATTLGVLSGMAGSYARNVQLIGQVRDALDAYPAGPLPADAGEAAFYAKALQRFDALARARDVALPPGQSIPWSRRFGLHQGRALARDVQDAYLRDLNGALLPALAQSLRRKLEQASNDPQRLYPLLKGYLMLGDPARRDVLHLATLAGTVWRQIFPDDASVRAGLNRHLRALLGPVDGARALALDRQQIEQTRASLRTAELPALVYGGLKLTQPGVDAGQAPRLDRRLGLLGGVFERRSGLPLSAPLPPLFTRQAFQAQTGGGIARGVQQFLADDWVLGTAPLDPLARSQLERQVLALYQRDYIAAWDSLLADLVLRPVAQTGQASAVAAKLGGPASPLKALLVLLREHTHALGRTPPAKGGAGAAAGGESTAAAEPDVAAEPIERHFEPLNRLLDGGPGTSALDETLVALTQMSRTLLGAAAGVAADQNDPALLIAAQQAEQLPPPLGNWMATLSGRGRALTASTAGEALRNAQRQAAGRECALLVSGRFPFVPGSRNDIPLRDFAELFGPGGRMDRFAQQSLLGKVDTSGRRWQWNPGMAAVGADDVLERAQLADEIKQAFFAGGGAQPQVAFTVSIPLQASISRLQLEVDGQTLDVREGARASQSMTWPGPNPGLVRVAAWDASGQALPVLEYRGPWAWFRALQAGRLRRSGDLDYTASLALASATVRMDVQPASLRHPFAASAVQRFSCP